MLLEIAERQPKDDVKYCMKFSCCSTNLSNEVRQRIIAKRLSNSQKEQRSHRKRKVYKQMEPETKRTYLAEHTAKYTSLTHTGKGNILRSKRQCYNKWYESLDPEEKEKLLTNKAEWYKSLDPEKKEKLLTNKAEWYKSLDPEDKETLLTNRAEFYKSLKPEDKQN